MGNYEYREEVPKMLLPQYPEPRIWISISKLGGGIPGRAYEGSWSYRVYMRGMNPLAGEDLTSGTPKTHREMARIVAGWLADSESSPAWARDQSDRLSLFAADELGDDNA